VIREIVAIFAEACPHWTFHAIAGGGHMAPLTRPEPVNPVVRHFLDAGSSDPLHNLDAVRLYAAGRTACELPSTSEIPRASRSRS
jgi:hypothetical protein